MRKIAVSIAKLTALFEEFRDVPSDPIIALMVIELFTDSILKSESAYRLEVMKLKC